MEHIRRFVVDVVLQVKGSGEQIRAQNNTRGGHEYLGGEAKWLAGDGWGWGSIRVHKLALR
jgi:hypothetical protein